jgi:DMSO/TMAO reductase YedYZ molybdopterin-dependent catalytic subunit
VKTLGLVFGAFLLLFSRAVVAADAPPVVAVLGDVTVAKSYTLAELQSLPATNVTARDHDGTNADYGGVSLEVLLRRAGAPLGEGMRGAAALTKIVVVHAADGYQASFSLAELDPALGGRTAILAWSRNGEALPVAQGPLRLVVPADQRQAR